MHQVNTGTHCRYDGTLHIKACRFLFFSALCFLGAAAKLLVLYLVLSSQLDLMKTFDLVTAHTRINLRENGVRYFAPVLIKSIRGTEGCSLGNASIFRLRRTDQHFSREFKLAPGSFASGCEAHTLGGNLKQATIGLNSCVSHESRYRTIHSQPIVESPPMWLR